MRFYLLSHRNAITVQKSTHKYGPEFKRNYYVRAEEISRRLSQNLRIPPKDAYDLLLSVYYHATGLQCSCQKNPLVEQEIQNLNMKIPEINFRDNLKNLFT